MNVRRERWEALPTGQAGLWVLRHDGLEVGTISLIPGSVALPSLHVQNMVRTLNHPPDPAEHTFGGPALVVLEQHRARRSDSQDRHPSTRKSRP